PTVCIRPPASVIATPLPAEYSYLQRVKPRRISVRHPGYDENDVPLLSLYGFDDAQGGLYYGLLHTACAIVADNRFDGYLSASSLPEAARLQVVNRDEILAAGEYWFHVP
ncbi:uncharacterized protein BCR38DRAFT_321259, partial [Pseudomassariella vexata]